MNESTKTTTSKTSAEQRDALPVFAKRLRLAKQRSGLKFAEIAARAELDEASASARMSQYAAGVHTPGYQTAVKLAEVLKVPVEYLYASDDMTAQMLLLWHSLPKARRANLLASLNAES